jgi:hypothetical protein
MIYSDAKAYIKVNGHLSKTIKLYKSIRQGCPLSALLFILCTEFLSLSINKCNNISCIKLDMGHEIHEIRCTQYADDTCLYLKDLDQVIPCLKALKPFSKVSGLQLHLHKTEGLCIGSLSGYIPDDQKINWPKYPIKYLGIFIGNDEKVCYKYNWLNKLEMLQKLLDSWRSWNLSLFGKVVIIKTLGIPKLVYSASLLHIPEAVIKKANKMLFNFLWGARDKIKRCVIINTVEEGGLKMCDLESQFAAIKGSWIKRILNSPNKIWARLSLFFLNRISCFEHLLQMTFGTKQQMPCLSKLPEFYQEVLLCLSRCNEVTNITSKSSLFNQMLWGNKQLTVKNICLYSETFIKSGFLYVKDILTQNGNIRPTVFPNLVNKKHYFKTMSLICKALSKYKTLRHMDETYTELNIQI